MKNVFGISKAVKQSGLSASALRRFEKVGWISPKRTAGGHRRYTKADVDALLKKLAEVSDILGSNYQPSYRRLVRPIPGISLGEGKK